MSSDKESPMGLKKGQKLDDLAHPEVKDEGEYKKQLKKAQLHLLKFQRTMGETMRSLIILFEGPDAAGKGGAIKRIVERLDPRLLRVHSVVKPTSEEYAHHYLWRFWNKLPPYSQTAIFDRSWYGRVLVERVEKFATEKEWRRAYQEINEFERLITDDGAIILKFYLHVSKSEQLARFKERQEDPYKHWKINEEDWRNRNKWKEHNTAAEEMFEKTSTRWAPWHVVPANFKWHARVKVLEAIVKTLEKTDLPQLA
ncbi:MAG TPA: UDP-galactose-lipid carrier transferase [Chthoniobacteraceae bacterium]|jgi:PPK2 family polyphosphate:nucleotide phosphotransferase|nr:UDP-galactose-lipid carrier transferase [Chthoniobacteraceae bacterium]